MIGAQGQSLMLRMGRSPNIESLWHFFHGNVHLRMGFPRQTFVLVTLRVAHAGEPVAHLRTVVAW